MLYPSNDYLLHIIKEETARQYRREVEIDHLAVASRPCQPSWLTAQTRDALLNLSHTLLAIGERLDRVEMRTAGRS